jgi:hypothetical protein
MGRKKKRMRLELRKRIAAEKKAQLKKVEVIVPSPAILQPKKIEDKVDIETEIIETKANIVKPVSVEKKESIAKPRISKAKPKKTTTRKKTATARKTSRTTKKS